MALAIKVLAALSLGNSPNAVVYSPAVGKSAVVNSIFITNQTANPITVHVGVRIAGGSFAYIHPTALQIQANGTFVFSDDITLAYPTGGSADKLEVWAGTASTLLHCVACGVERNI